MPLLTPTARGAALGSLLALGAAVPATAQTPQTVTAIGTAEVRPNPSDRTSNDAIRRAVAAARREAVPLAVAAGRGRAVEIGAATGLNVGGVLAVEETAPSPFYGGNYGELGTFGPGRYCGRVNRYRFVRDANGRILRRVRTGSRRSCRVPSRISVSVTITYAATPRS